VLPDSPIQYNLLAPTYNKKSFKQYRRQTEKNVESGKMFHFRAIGNQIVADTVIIITKTLDIVFKSFILKQ